MTDNIHTVNLPDIGEGVVEGEVIEWLKNVGDELVQDEAVVVVMTDKATVELPAPYPGTLSKQYFSAGEIAIKDKPLYDITLQEAVVVQGPRKTKATEKPQYQPPPKRTLKAVHPYTSSKALATPPIRKLAKDLSIDINAIKGTGPDGRITQEDIQTHCSSAKLKPPVEYPRFPDDTIEPIVGIPRLMAEKMAQSKQNAAHFSYFEQIDATRLVQLRQNIKKQASEEGIRLTYMPFFIRALSLSIKKYPKINSSIDIENHELILHKQQNIGIAINTDLGLIVPVMYGVQDMTFEDIIREFDKLKTAALTHKLKSQDMKGSTISISNFGVLGGGGMWATPVINYPEVAILAVARIQKRPIVKNDELLVRDTLNLSWSFDHRIVDGDMAARFSNYYGAILQNPASLV
jgi:pyruvate/2-oxoglutarate dehydrogenase complex dihydrolipoamide acyltransferase (E2) component